MRGLWALALVASSARAQSCYPLQFEGGGGSGDASTQGIALQVCLPLGPTLNCDHCTHAGSLTACWELNSRCLSDTLQDTYKLENWGFDEAGEWKQNFDLTGNHIKVEAVCRDQYGGNCFKQLAPGEGNIGGLRTRRAALCGALVAAGALGRQ